MARLNGFLGNITDPLGAYLQAKAGFYIYVFRQGGNVASNSTGTTLTLRSGDGVNFTNGDYVQLGTDSSTVRLISSGGGTDSLTLASAVSAVAGQRVLNLGTVLPVSGVYDPHSSTNSGSLSTIYPEDNSASTAISNSKLTTDSDGDYSFYTNSGQYDFLIQDSNKTNLRILAGIDIGVIINVNLPAILASDYGAVGDGVTDDASSIQAALTAAAGTTNGGIGGTVYLAKGTFKLGSQITIPNKVRLVGFGRSASILKAAAGVAPATGLVRIGDGTGIVFGSRIENLTVDCNNVASSIGVYSTEANEQSGVYCCVITGFTTNGIKFVGASCQNAFIEVTEIYASASGATSGIYLTGTAGIIHLRHLTINGDSGSPMTHCIDNEDTIAAFGIHGEYATNLIYFDTGSNGDARSVFGHTSITSCINISAAASNGILLGAIYTNGATNSILDARSSRTLTSSSVALYCLGDGAGSGAQVFSSVGGLAAAKWFINAAVGGTVVTFANGDTTPTVGIGNVFKTNNAAPTSITTFDDGTQGQKITVIFTDGNTTLVHSAGFRLNGAGNIIPTANDVINFVFDGGTWFMTSPISAT